MGGTWLRQEQAELAVGRILDAAGRAFVELGVSKAGMGEVARIAGCSRGTLYRYFKTREELQLAFVNRTALDIAARVALRIADIEAPRERLTAAIVESVAEVRRTPEAAVWFTPGDSGTAAIVSRHSEVIPALADAFVAALSPASEPEPDSDGPGLAAKWIVRAILSLLAMPAADAAEEHELVSRFVVAGLLGD